MQIVIIESIIIFYFIIYRIKIIEVFYFIFDTVQQEIKIKFNVFYIV